MNKILNNKFRFFYPGVYNEEEQEELKRFQERRDRINLRGPVDLDALTVDKLLGEPGVSKLVVTDEENRRAALQFDPENPLYADDDYARAAGYRERLAWPSFASHDHSYTVPMPPLFRDILMPTAHEVETSWFAPIYVGDTLYAVCMHQDVDDITTQAGSEFRTFAISCGGKVYNQDKTHVADYEIRIQENLRLIDHTGEESERSVVGSELGHKRARSKLVTQSEIDWECPNWWHRPPHVYTDEDYAFIKDIWKKESRRGSEPLYWEDVNVGDEPAWTLEGPIRETVHPSNTVGMGSGGSRTLKKEILDPDIFKTMLRDPRDGIWYLPGDPEIDYTKDPDHDVYDCKDYRHNMINYFSRDCAMRMIHNWIGDRGWLARIDWLIMPVALGYEDRVGEFRDPPPRRWLEKVPYMKGKRAVEHGLENDIYIVKGYVCDKFVKDGKHCAELVWWIETIDNAIVTEGDAIVELPTRA